MKSKILVTGTSVRPELLQPLVENGYTIDNPTHLLSEAELKEKLETSVGYLLGGDEIASRNTTITAKSLKIIAFLGMGYQSFIDVEAATEFNIPITYTPGTLSNSVAEFTIGVLLSSTRKLYLYATDYSVGKIGTEEKQHDLINQKIGIVGLGGIGTRIAEILKKGLDANVSYFSRTRKEGEEKRLGINYLELDKLTSEVDILIIMTPGNSQTKSMIGDLQVEKFKKGLILINTARPDIIDPESLLKGLQTGQIGYAAFDGFYEEPKEVVTKLKEFIPSRLMVTGHIASLTHEARDGMAKMAVGSILNVLKSGKDKHIVNLK